MRIASTFDRMVDKGMSEPDIVPLMGVVNACDFKG